MITGKRPLSKASSKDPISSSTASSGLIQRYRIFNEVIINALARRGCPDLTSSIKLAACSARPLAGGGFCDVYRGTMSQGTKIAIKCLRLYDKPGRDSEKAKILKRAARELYHWSKLRHPNVLPLMGLAMFRGHMAMISEWMNNGDLMSYVRLNPGVNRISLCMDVCAGLLYIHANGMAHGDLKGANIMVCRNGTAIIADFGNSQLRDLTLRFTNTTSSSLSVRWAAPELLDGGDGLHASKKADVYAFGMTVLETLTGKVPFDGLSEHRVMFMVMLKRKTPAKPITGVSNELWEILKYCWTWDSAERPEMAKVEERLRVLFASACIETNDDLNPSHLRARNFDVDGAIPLVAAAEDDDPEQLHRMANLAITYHKQGRLAEAESLKIKVLDARKRVLGPTHLHTLQSMTSLAMTYHQQNRLADAELLYAEVLATRKQLLGQDHPDTLDCMSNLAMTYHQQGQLEDAAALGAKVVDTRKRVLGEDHPDTLHSLGNLASTYNRQGRLADAESLEFEVLTARKRVLGADHPHTLKSMANLAVTFNKQGRLDDAESLEVAVVAARQRVLGDDHPDTLRSLKNLALTYFKQDRLEEAESLHVETLVAQKRVFGDYHPDTLQTMRNLADTYKAQGREVQYRALVTQIDAMRAQWD